MSLNLSWKRKIIIGLILLISTLILWYQVRQRMVISRLPSNIKEAQKISYEWQLYDERQRRKEGFGIFTSQETDMKNQLANVSKPIGQGAIITYNSTKMGNLPIKEYIIKSSFNSACTGTLMNKDMIKYVLSRGCRFLDFQLYYNTDDRRTYVSVFLPDNTTKVVDNDLLFDTALNVVNSFGFSGPSPNLGDPLFIQLRLNINNRYGVAQYKKDMLEDIATSIQSNLANRVYDKKVKIDTNINDLMGKFIIISDNIIKDTNDQDLVNILAGNGKFPKFTSQDVDSYMSNYITIGNDRKSNVNMIRFVEPLPNDSINMNAIRITNQYSSQFVEQMYYKIDKGLNDYENLFFNFGTAFIPFYLAKKYFSELK